MAKYLNMGVTEYWVADIDKYAIYQFKLDFENKKYSSNFVANFAGELKHDKCGFIFDVLKVFKDFKLATGFVLVDNED